MQIDNYTQDYSISKHSTYTPMKVKMASALGSGIAALGAAYMLSKGQTKNTGKLVDIYSVKYGPKEILALSTASLIGGTTAGILSDKKKHTKAKYKEGIHQMVANIVSPLIAISAVEKLSSKFINNIKFPKSKSDKSLLNTAVKIIPNFMVVLTGLVSGLSAGTIIANKINSKIFGEEEKKELTPNAFCYHVDDIATSLSIADKTCAMQKSLGKIIPPILSIIGYEAGSKR